jgi:hypothetical protein
LAELEAQRKEQEEREQRKAKLQADYERSIEARIAIPANQIERGNSGTSLLLTASDGSLAGQLSHSGTDDFVEALDNADFDEDERQRLRFLRIQREREEQLRKKKLQEEYDLQQQQIQEEQMRQLQLIVEQKKHEEQSRSAEIQVNCRRWLCSR